MNFKSIFAILTAVAALALSGAVFAESSCSPGPSASPSGPPGGGAGEHYVRDCVVYNTKIKTTRSGEFVKACK